MPEPTPRAGWRRLPRSVRLPGLLAAAALVWTLAGAVLLPALLKPWLAHTGSQRLGRAVTIDSLHVNPWSLTLRAAGLRVAGTEPGAAPALALDALEADASIASVWQRATVLDTVRLRGLHVRASHAGAGRYDFDDVVQRLRDAAAAARPGAPPRVVLHGLRVEGGAVDFTDRSRRTQHALRDLELDLPSLSTLPGGRDAAVAPRLAFTLDGDRFDTAASATPFADARRADATLRVADVDLAPWLAYWPSSLPWRLAQGTLGAELRTAWGPDGWRIAGTLVLQRARLLAPNGQPLLAADRLQADITALQPLAGRLHLARVTGQGVQLALARDAEGQWNAVAIDSGAGRSAPTLATGTNDSKKPRWAIQLDALDLRSGRVTVADAAAGGNWQLDGVAVQGSALRWPQDAAVPARLQVQAGVAGGGRLALDARGGLGAGSLAAEWQALPVPLGAPLAVRWLQPALGGRGSGKGSVQWDAAGWRADFPQLAVEAATLGPARAPLAAARRIAVEGLTLDGAARSVQARRLAITGLDVAAQRGADGRWAAAQWLARRADVPAAAAPSTPWRWSLAELAVDGGRIVYEDLAAARPVRLAFAEPRLRLANLGSGDGAAPQAFALQAGVGSGTLDFDGRLATAPFQLDGRLAATDLPLHAIEPYFGDRLAVRLQRADVSFAGNLRFAVPAAPGGSATLALQGDGALEDVRADRIAGTAADPVTEGLLRWRSMALRGLAVSIAPGQRTSVALGELRLADFFARLAIDEQGRINLLDVFKPRTPVAPETIATKADGTLATAPNDPKKGESAPARIAVASTTLANGRIALADRFIQPNYTASLTQVGGTIGAFASDDRAVMAPVALRAVADGSASVQVNGSLNPVSRPPALDIRASMQGLDLPPLSAYSVKYAGYGIERGKLGMDVHYRVDPDGTLLADNRVVLQQLAFSEAGQARGGLPLKLAASLLADRDGVIRLDLPIRGSINDPDFNVTPLVWRALGSLVARAVTSPLSLLAGGRGGRSQDVGDVVFAPGSARLDAAAGTLLDTTAQSLVAKPALRMTVSAEASLAAEGEAWRRERLRQRVQNEKRRALQATDPAATSAPPFTEAEYPALLEAVLRRSEQRRPRNAIGLPRSLSVAETEALLLAERDPTEEAMRELARQRVAAVRDRLIERGVPPERIYLGANHSVAGGPAWQPVADLRVDGAAAAAVEAAPTEPN